MAAATYLYTEGNTTGTLSGSTLTLAGPGSATLDTLTDTSGNAQFNVGDSVRLGSTPFPAQYLGYITISGTNVPVVYFAGSDVYFVVSNAVIPAGTYTLNAASLACFLAGTRIRTENGTCAVETLCVGDRVETIDGRLEPIVWIGHRRVPAAHASQQPVHIRAHALGCGIPCRDLFVSPEHAMYLDGVLVPAEHLVNGDTITRAALADITYFHIMLNAHEVIYAEDAPTESFIANDNFGDFDNAHEAPTLFAAMEPSVERVTQGAKLHAILARLNTLETA